MGFNEKKFNESQFNEKIIPDNWELFLNPDNPILVATGSGVDIPPRILKPCQRYLLVRSVGSFITKFTFATPSGLTYDSLGG